MKGGYLCSILNAILMCFLQGIKHYNFEKKNPEGPLKQSGKNLNILLKIFILTFFRKKLFFVAIIAISLSNLQLVGRTMNEDLLTKIQSCNAKVQNGMLVIENSQMAEELNSLLLELSEEQRYDWENEMGFRSMFGLLYESEIKDIEYFQSYRDQGLSDNMILEQIEKGEIMSNSGFTQTLIDLGVFKQTKLQNGQIRLDVNINPTVSLQFVNAEGFVKLDGQIYLFTERNKKVLLDGDFSKISSLSKSNATDFSNSIVVEENISKSTNIINMYYGCTSISWGEDYNIKSQGGVNLSSSLLFSKLWYRDASIGFRSEIKVYLSNATYKYSAFKWRRKSYTTTTDGYISYGKQDGNACGFNSGTWGETLRIHKGKQGDIVDLVIWKEPLSLANTGCFPGGSGYIDPIKYMLNGISLDVKLDQTENGENDHPTVWHYLSSSQAVDSWNDIIMSQSK